MSERFPCQFMLIRYVPDVVKGEFVNIGIVVLEMGAQTDSASCVRFTRDWSRLRCLDKDADIEMLEELEREIESRLQAGVTVQETKAVLDVLRESLSNSLQISEPQGTLAENIFTEVDLLMGMYVEPMKVARVRAVSGRAAVLAGMRTEFERAGVWQLMRKRIAASMYTRPGDPMKIDCGYRVAGPGPDAGGIVRMFQAVSLEGDVEAAKVLAFTAPQLREGLQRVEAAALELTAVVESLRSVARETGEESDEVEERYRFGVETMEREAIRVMTVADLGRMAATARVELRV